IFQNAEDERIFATYSVPMGEVGRTRGSGIDLATVRQAPYPQGDELRIVYAGRLVRSKGVEDFCRAAELLRPQLEGRVRFVICGGVSDNPQSLSREEVSSLADGRYIEWLGHCDDVPEQLGAAVMVVYPSYYREGVPRVLLEACAVGRAIITTDSVGCRDTVEDGRNGYLVPVRTPSAIAERIMELIQDRNKCMKMGLESRRRAERLYDIRDVIRVHERLYGKALKELKTSVYESDAYH
ncbi:MAG: glycosyltransferase, partial [Muribaculaceae bacterium]|nr:glycosyltransferase [Muribaculaceae bacterium]